MTLNKNNNCNRNENFIKKATSLIIKSLLYEVSCYPSPGLVSPISKGAHKDMDYYTFLDSISEIGPSFEEILKIGMSSIPENKLLSSIRPIGLEIENKMFNVTNGVNTHKGLIFLMSIVAVSASIAYYKKLPFSSIKNIIKEVSFNLVKNELESNKHKKNKTYGEKIFEKYRIDGVRGEAQRGFPTVFNYSLPFYKKYKSLNLNERLYSTLICIMAYCKDSTILHRHDIEVLDEVNKKCKDILAYFNNKEIEIFKEEVLKLDKEFSKRRISPGGSADLLAITVFLDSIELYFNI